MNYPFITIDAGSKSTLKWPSLEFEIENHLKTNETLSFAFDFDFDPEEFNFKDEITFFSLSIAVGEFIRRVADPFTGKIKRICLYKGKADFSRAILRYQTLYQSFIDWKEENFAHQAINPHLLKLFSIQLMMQYLHQLAAPLPDDIDIFVQIEGLDSLRPSERVELISDEHFSYITLDRAKNNEATIGVVLPQIGQVNYDVLDQILLTLDGQNISYRVIPEKLLTEKWCGIDELIVISRAVSTEGIRMLQGFNAAMGSVIWIGDAIEGIEGESFERRFGAEGFEPPTFWSQTRRASQTALCSE